MIGLLVGVAQAGEPELEVERGRVAFEREEYQAARDRAISALGEAPGLGGAHQLYVDATTAAGLGSRGLFELVSLEVTNPAWFEVVFDLSDAVDQEEWKAIRAGVETVVVTFPEAPEQLAPLWDSDWPKVVKLRERMLQALVSPPSLAAADVEKLYRIRRLALEAGDPDAVAATDQALVALGEDQPPPRPRLTRLERADLALTLSKDPIPALPWGYPSELVDVMARLAEVWAKAGRHRHVALGWQQVQRLSDDATAWTGEAAAWLAGDDPEKAMVAANSALSRATRPRAVDLAAMNAERQRADVAAALTVRARIREKTGDVPAALADLALASLFAGQLPDDKLGERLDERSAAAAAVVQGQYPVRSGTASDAAIAKAAASADHDQAIGILQDARFLASIGTRAGKLVAESPTAYADVFARSFVVEAEVEKKAGRVDQARTAAVIATLLTEREHPWWWATRAELHERNGEYDAAFASWAVARGLGVPELDEKLAGAYVGVAEWEIAANNIGGPPPEVALAPETPPGQLASRGTSGRPRRTASERPSTAPRLGEVFPNFSIDTGYGQVTSASVGGRVLVMTFWESDCEECLQMLPTFGSLARRLRRDGRDVFVLGVSTDEDREDFERVYELGQRWTELAWAPALEEKFAVDRHPTTWVVDRTGVARYYVDHWLSAEELESYVRELD